MTLMSSYTLLSQNIFNDNLKKELYAYLESRDLAGPLKDPLLLEPPNFSIINLITNNNVLIEPEDVRFGIYGFKANVVSSPLHILLKNGSDYEIFEMIDYTNDISYEYIVSQLLNYFKKNNDLNREFLLPIYNNIIYEIYMYNIFQRCSDSALIKKVYDDILNNRTVIEYIE